MDKVSIENFKACLLGGAIGDALGAPIEFYSLDRIRSEYSGSGIIDFVEFSDNFGEFTDDTQMTLFTAEALLRAHHRAMLIGIGGALNQIAYDSYLRWLHTQNNSYELITASGPDNQLLSGWLIKEAALYKRRAPGNTCIAALEGERAGTIHAPINNSKGCGTIMRMAPVGLMYPGEPEKCFDIGCDLAAITHGHPSGILSAGFFAGLISLLAAKEDLANAILRVLQILLNHKEANETAKAVISALELVEKSSEKELKAENIEHLGSGWVAEEALSISLYASLLYSKDYKTGVLYAINHSGDSDSTGSITGNILGLINGMDSIPDQWIRNLRHHEIVEVVAEDLHIQVKGDSYESDDEWWEKYPGA